MQASTRSRNKAVQGGNFPERPGWAPTNGRPRRDLPGAGAGLLRRLSGLLGSRLLSNFAPDRR
jgi:hypothetical protein